MSPSSKYIFSSIFRIWLQTMYIYGSSSYQSSNCKDIFFHLFEFTSQFALDCTHLFWLLLKMAKKSRAKLFFAVFQPFLYHSVCRNRQPFCFPSITCIFISIPYNYGMLCPILLCFRSAVNLAGFPAISRTEHLLLGRKTGHRW